MTMYLSIGEILEPAPQIPADEMSLLAATMDAYFAVQPPRVEQPSLEQLLTAKRETIARQLDARTRYLSLQAQVSSDLR